MTLSRRAQNKRREARDYVERRLRLNEYDDLADVLAGVQVEYGAAAPGRSTFYKWVKEWRVKQARDPSDPWSLADENTGQPQVVLRVLAALHGLSRGKLTGLRRDDARTVVIIARAAPRLLDERPLPVTVSNPWGHPLMTLYVMAQRYRAAAGDDAELAALDLELALDYASKEGGG